MQLIAGAGDQAVPNRIGTSQHFAAMRNFVAIGAGRTSIKFDS
jgi:hypothetical protein